MELQSKGSIEIRNAELKDREVLIQLYLDLLKDSEPFGYDVIPSRENAEKVTDLILLPSALRGEPTLIAWDNEKPVGCYFIITQQLPYQTKWKTAYEFGFFVKEEYRSKKIGFLMRKKGITMMKERGFEKIYTTPLSGNQKVISTNSRFGFKPYGQVDVLDLSGIDFS